MKRTIRYFAILGQTTRTTKIFMDLQSNIPMLPRGENKTRGRALFMPREKVIGCYPSRYIDLLGILNR